jgi:hypothetical protein
LKSVLTQYNNIHDKVFHNSTLWKRKVKVTYLLHLRVVLVLTMVISRPHHLRHQWSQISTFVSLNHIHRHTSFKSSYVHIQVFQNLHHNTMKLLQALEPFQLERPIVEIGSEDWLAACRTIQQWKLVRCGLHNSAAKTGSLPPTQFSSENCFVAEATISAANVTLLQPTRFRQRMLIHCRKLNSGSES